VLGAHCPRYRSHDGIIWETGQRRNAMKKLFADNVLLTGHEESGISHIAGFP
jgi:hypothetical protein